MWLKSFLLMVSIGYVLSNPVNSDEHKCPENEYWSYCVLGVCGAKKCDEIGFSLPCSSIISPCSGGCVCKEGYVRMKEHDRCIPEEQCPICGGDKNATGGCIKSCKNNYENHCYNYKNNVTCEQTCDYYGCECKDGYVYDDVTERCVLPDDCLVPCNGDPHAFIKPGCSSSCPPTCAVPNPIVCNELCILNACTCKYGWILDKKGGACIKVYNCPSNLGCNGDSNAVITSCPDPCPSTCKLSTHCSKGDEPYGCVCKDGFINSFILKKVVNASTKPIVLCLVNIFFSSLLIVESIKWIL